MGRIQSTVGLFSGIDYGTLVNELISIDSEPMDQLQSQDTTLQTQEQAIEQLAADLTSVQGSAKALEQSSVYDATTATPSNTSISANVTGTPTVGTYEFTPLQMATNQQLLSSGFESETDPIGAGQLTLRFGDGVDRSMSLADLNGGAGVPGGKIRITDKAGQSAIIDLSTAQTVGNVLDAINSNTSIQVKAVANGDGIQLTDETGSSTGTLSVSNVGNDTTATALGLTTLDSNGNGTSIVYLSDNLSLDAINDGNGMTANASLPDIHYQLSNGDKGDINLASTASGSSPTTQPQTLGQVLDIINAADPGKLVASISSDGQHLVVSDESGGNGSFSFTAENGSTALASLGLTGTPSNGVITGGQLLAGTQDVLLSSLNGGQGMGPLGQIEITNRNASSPVTVNLSNDATLGQVINSINAAKAGVTAQINPSDDGIELVDTSGGSGKLVVADAPGSTTSTAEALGIAVNAATSSVDSGDLHLQVVSASTPLASLNGGAGVAQGSFTITDSKGNTTTINLSSSSIQTVGNVINLINRSTVNVQAQIDSTGNGIELVNTAGGSGTLTVQEGGSTTAGDLHLLSSATASNDNGIKTQTIDGSGTYTVKWDDTAALSNVLTQIQGLNMGVSAQIIGDGSDSPYQLSLTSNQGGKNGAMVVNTSQAGFDFSQTVASEAHSCSSAVVATARSSLLLPTPSRRRSTASASPSTRRAPSR